MARKTPQELEKIIKDNNVSRLFSWSRYNCYKTSPYEYFLRYVKKERATRNNIYSVIGSNVHDLIESFYDGKIKYEDMIDEYQSAFLNATIMELKFNRDDDDKNEKIEDKYNACIEHFFRNHKPIKHKIVMEKHLLIWVNKFLFGGYFDAVHKDEDGNYIVTDWKSSTIYTGKKIDKEKGQLLLYSEGLRQLGVPLEKIKARWCFLKYLDITYPLKKTDGNGNHETKTTHAERHAWFGKIKTNVKMWLKDSGKFTEEEIDNMLNYSLEFNTIDNLPKDIQGLYKIEDCYIEAPVTEEEIDILKKDIYQTLIEIHIKERDYEKTGDDKVFWEEITDAQSYYFANLCSYNAVQHKPYGEYLSNKELFVNNEFKTDKNTSEIEDNSWMLELGLID